MKFAILTFSPHPTVEVVDSEESRTQDTATKDEDTNMDVADDSYQTPNATSSQIDMPEQREHTNNDRNVIENTTESYRA